MDPRKWQYETKNFESVKTWKTHPKEKVKSKEEIFHRSTHGARHGGAELRSHRLVAPESLDPALSTSHLRSSRDSAEPAGHGCCCQVVVSRQRMRIGRVLCLARFSVIWYQEWDLTSYNKLEGAAKPGQTNHVSFSQL